MNSEIAGKRRTMEFRMRMRLVRLRTFLRIKWKSLIKSSERAEKDMRSKMFMNMLGSSIISLVTRQ
jgi:hypothetical protein